MSFASITWDGARAAALADRAIQQVAAERRLVNFPDESDDVFAARVTDRYYQLGGRQPAPVGARADAVAELMYRRTPNPMHLDVEDLAEAYYDSEEAIDGLFTALEGGAITLETVVVSLAGQFEVSAVSLLGVFAAAGAPQQEASESLRDANDQVRIARLLLRAFQARGTGDTAGLAPDLQTLVHAPEREVPDVLAGEITDWAIAISRPGSDGAEFLDRLVDALSATHA